MSEVKHPCYDPKASVSHGRIHLPVAKGCNIQCNYCNRLYDCVNESRPGVTSAVLSPRQALFYMEKVLQKIDCEISVTGIAGPGDPFADPQNTIDTMRLVKEKYPDMILCLASNGLNVAEYAGTLKDIGVGHVTITMSAVDPEITAKIISWARYKGRVARGLEAGKLLLDRQILAVRALKENGITVKINSIVIPGINEEHVSDVAAYVKGLGADVMNILPMKPVTDTPFETITQPDHELMQKIRWKSSESMKIVHHCAMCRADAAGRLGMDNTAIVNDLLKTVSKMPIDPLSEKKHVAVASREGVLVNEHLGRALQFHIYDISTESFKVIDIRNAPENGSGDERWLKMSEILKDCKAIVVSSAGGPPKKILENAGIKVYTTEGLIDQALQAIYNGSEPKQVVCVKSCTGGGCGSKPCG